MLQSCEHALIAIHNLVPSSAPAGVSGSAVSPVSIILTWSPLPEGTQNGAVRMYSVRVLEVDTNTFTLHNVTETSLVLSSLHPYYVYRCSVAAVTVGSGPYSDTLSIRTHEAGGKKMIVCVAIVYAM